MAPLPGPAAPRAPLHPGRHGASCAPGQGRAMTGFFRIFMAGVSIASMLFTLAAGTMGALMALALGLPLPWLLGSLLAVGGLAAGGRSRLPGPPLAMPPRLRFLFVPVIGGASGGGFTPELMAEAPRWWVTLGALCLFIPLAHLTSYLIFLRAGGIDRVTAFYAAMPGGLMESLQLGEEAGADIQYLTMLQFLRLTLCIALVPIGFTLATGEVGGSAAGGRMAGAEAPRGPGDALVLLAAAAGGFRAGRWLRLPAAIIVGPMLASAAAHIAGLTAAAPPGWLIDLTQLVVGTSLGARFAGLSRGRLGRAMGLSFMATGTMLAMAWGAALLLHIPAGERPETVFLAFAPGGVAEMTLIALSLQTSAVYVTAHHVLRILIAVVTAQLAFRRR